MTDNSELFVLYKQVPGGGEIWLMLGLETTDSDYKDILSISECLAAEGHKVKVLHAVHYKDPLYKVVFGELIGTRYYRKCPDLLVDGEYVEYESYTTNNPKNAFRNIMHHGLSQSDSIIIRQCSLTDGYMLRQIRGAIKEGEAISSVGIYNGVSVRPLYKLKADENSSAQ